MARRVDVTVERFPLQRAFRISRGAKTEAVVLTCVLEEDGAVGRGECVPYARYGESVESVTAEIEAVRGALAGGSLRHEIARDMRPGAARNAVDCALWDLEARHTGAAVSDVIAAGSPAPLTTAYTIGLDEPEAMAAAAAEAGRPLLKIKLGADGDIDRLHAVRKAVPHTRLVVDANEGWNETNLREHLIAAAACGVLLVEQPLPDGKDAILATLPHPVPICADESAHTSDELDALVGRYDFVNVKLDKTGGLTEALRMIEKAHSIGFGVMVGCMVGSSLGMAPAVLAAQRAEFVDLDGPLLLAKDRENGLRYDGSVVYPPDRSLWG